MIDKILERRLGIHVERESVVAQVESERPDSEIV